MGCWEEFFTIKKLEILKYSDFLKNSLAIRFGEIHCYYSKNILALRKKKFSCKDDKWWTFE